MNFHGLTTLEIQTWPQKAQNWRHLMLFGGLPGITQLVNPTLIRKRLRAYSELYLKEEVMQEGLVRNVPEFSRFLHVAGLCAGQQIVFEKIASDMEVSSKTVRSWFQILEDTLVAQILPCFGFSKMRKAVQSGKFYFFDNGVANYLRGNFELVEGTSLWGDAFEHLVYTQLRAFLDYSETELQLSFWRTDKGLEIDFVIHKMEEPIAIFEVKAKKEVSERDLRGIRAFAEEFPVVRKIVVALGPAPLLTTDSISILPAETFFESLWAHRIFGENVQ